MGTAASARMGAPIGRLELARRIDHTNLSPTATVADINRLCDEALKHSFWSVCVGPSYVRHASRHLMGTEVKVCSVVGFPMGFTLGGVKLAEAREEMRAGADEIDMVMNIAAFKSEDYAAVSREIEEVAELCRGNGGLLKVIIECCYLTDEEKVGAARLAERAGADFVKTSTGLGPSGATIRDVVLLKAALLGTAKVKAAGGIRTLDNAVEIIRAGADRIGTSSGAKIMAELKSARPQT